MAADRLYRSRNRVLGGVLAGFAEYFSIDVVLVRVIYVLLSLFSAGFPGLLVYIIFWIVTPEKPFNPYNEETNS
ncbi:phage shock protein C (PspC) family protein [Draconibacterium orientale]|jgi:phage shock protein C|uniref:Phage shock protein C (PspC) family protein n=1 Tax=Draconibacterium orientale TaxID=1168034 RepID=X5DWL5_9BACT|nr:PspC domain-containing protein [Draconibacterium orientale]AHW58651.1 stress-responsive transcriptional regulator [Draconibacterium orientale]SET13470.1 phage shock protein C (PspC) family protein [Draconibacterium orientale]